MFYVNRNATEHVSAKLSEEHLRPFRQDFASDVYYIFLKYTLYSDEGDRVEESLRN